MQKAKSGGQDIHVVACTSGTKNLVFTQQNLEVVNNGRPFETVKGTQKVSAGRYYYEVKLQTNGLMQIGWVTDQFSPDATAGNGVGDDAYSWAYDGQRVKKWHKGESSQYGQSWATGDVIGAAVDFQTASISFYRNGTLLGEAYASFSAGSGLYPAVSFSQRQRATFNFGKTPLAHLPPGYGPLHSNISETDRIALVKLFDNYKSIGRKLNESSDIDVIRAQGTLQFSEDLGVTEETDPLMLIIAFKLGAKGLWEFTYDDFVLGFSRFGVGTLAAIKKVAREWEQQILQQFSAEWKAFYFFVFDYLKEDKKILLLEEAVMVWNMVFPARWPLFTKWLEFVQSTNMKSISRDTWQQLYEFATHNASSVVDYDPDSSWPVAIDEFVEWLKKPQ